MTDVRPGTAEWLDQVIEPIIEPDLPVIDPHHHLWPDSASLPDGTARRVSRL